MSRATKRIIGNISVLTVLVALVAVLAFSAMSPTFLKNDAKLTAEANAGTPIVQALNTPKATPTPSLAKKVDPAQAWADDMINLLLNGNSKSSFGDFNKDLPHHYIESWSQPKQGVLAIEVKDRNWSKCDLDSLGMNVLDTAGWDNPGLIQVVVSNERGSLVRESPTNEENKNRESAIPDSCA
ncbi:hypothetical protein [Glutamicibacter ardleyensis]|uniref:hypothetical protein n=1 Tax=Glutamicibacter ardleyensis TaxID=225894 RepID=UPI003FD2DE81